MQGNQFIPLSGSRYAGGLIAAAQITSNATPVAVDFATDFEYNNGSSVVAIDLFAKGTLQTLTFQNRDTANTVEIILDGLPIGFILGAGQALIFGSFGVSASVELKSVSGDCAVGIIAQYEE